MKRDLSQFFQQEYDLLIIGGGINGCATANLAAREGLKVALVEQKDFASGTSSKSTKLIHGGIRYLEHFEFDLVRESLKERHAQIQTIPYLVKPIPFIIPVYKKDARPLWMMKLGVRLYDMLAGRYNIGKHRTLSVDEVIQHEPNIRKEGLMGGVLYYDAQMDDARICLENILEAREHGADVANYCEASNFLRNGERVVGIMAHDSLTDSVYEVRAKHVVCAVGPWSNIIYHLNDHKGRKVVRTTKGIHIVYKGKLTDHAVVFSAGEDKRIFFVIPWLGNTLIGTTDTNYILRPETAAANWEDVAYLFHELEKFFPQEKFCEENIITTFAGLRPLLRKGGSPSAVSRRHAIRLTETGVVFVLGGKYTTYRKMAEETLKKFGIQVRQPFCVYGSGPMPDNPQAVAQKYKVEESLMISLQQTYGARFKDVLDLIKKDPTLAEPICTCSSVIKAQVIYAKEVEMAQKPDDIIWRRLNLAYLACPTKKCRAYVEKVFKK